jgi:quercetin dioxygenase-like cupin family protein
MIKKLAILTVLLVTLGVVTWGGVPSGAQDDPPPIQVEPITPRSTFPDDVDVTIRVAYDADHIQLIEVSDPSRIVVARITVQVGAQFPWHTHPGPVIVTVQQGELTYVNANDCVERVYPTGTAFIDPGHGNVHTAYNSSDEVTVLTATFLEAPQEGPLTIPTDAPQDCHVQVGVHDGAH